MRVFAGLLFVISVTAHAQTEVNWLAAAAKLIEPAPAKAQEAPTKVEQARRVVEESFRIWVPNKGAFISASDDSAQNVLRRDSKARTYLAHLKYQLNQNRAGLDAIAKREKGRIEINVYSAECEDTEVHFVVHGKYLDSNYDASFSSLTQGCDISKTPEIVKNMIEGLEGKIKEEKSNTDTTRETQNLVNYLESSGEDAP